MARLFVDNLTVIDFSYLDKERGIVGESWIVDIELTGDLDDQGMVFDFGDVKKQIKHFIDAEIDHCLLVPLESLGCSTALQASTLSIEFPLSSGGTITHHSPQDAVCLIDGEKIEASRIALDLQARIKAILPANVKEVQIKLRNEDIKGAYYQYTHGLQKHLGQCQRIAHGHRSRIEIEIGGERSPESEAQWSERLEDCYIATESHISEEFELNGIAHTRLAYTAEQGSFSISLPSAQLFVIPTESTVENIAHHIAELTSAECNAEVLVKAYEGLDKGAIGVAG